MSDLIFEDWLAEQDMPMIGDPSPAAGSPGGALPLGAGPGGFDPKEAPPGRDPNAPPDPNITQQGLPGKPEDDDVTKDPSSPDMPEEKDDLDFEEWKNKYFKESIKGDPNDLLDLLGEVKNRELNAYEYKFIWDNIQIQYLRQNANIHEASNKIRKLIRDQLDQNNPATSIVNHMEETLKTMPELNNVFIKMIGLLGGKGDAHRKYIGALTTSVQVGSGAGFQPDLIFNEKDYAIKISSRFNAEWGDVFLGKWTLKEDDPERFLEKPELERMEDDGSPEEKDVLRRRVVMESIADAYKKRAFVINVVAEDGTIYTLGWDLANSLQSAYKEGKLVVRAVKSEDSEAMIDDDGAIIALLDLKINYLKPTGKFDAEGEKETEELPFIERKDGMLFLVADLDLVKEAASTLQGITFKSTPYNGNPSDLNALKRSVPDVTELILRNP
jgi:hypothetical protein